MSTPAYTVSKLVLIMWSHKAVTSFSGQSIGLMTRNIFRYFSPIDSSKLCDDEIMVHLEESAILVRLQHCVSNGNDPCRQNKLIKQTKQRVH
jgi:hypothetical protein